jgi:hypothetical protein
MPLQVDQCGPVTDAFALRPVIHAEDSWRRVRRHGHAADQGDEQPRAGGDANLLRESSTRLTAECEGNRVQEGGEPDRRACRRRHNVRQSLGEDAPGTGRVEAEELANMEREADGMPGPGKICRMARIMAVNASRGLLTEGTGRCRSG